MDCYYQQVVDLIDPDHGLLQQLLTARCISSEQKSHIESGSSSRERSSRIIECLRQKDELYLVSLVDCLKRTKQHRVILTLPHTPGKITTLALIPGNGRGDKFEVFFAETRFGGNGLRYLFCDIVIDPLFGSQTHLSTLYLLLVYHEENEFQRPKSDL